MTKKCLTCPSLVLVYYVSIKCLDMLSHSIERTIKLVKYLIKFTGLTKNKETQKFSII